MFNQSMAYNIRSCKVSDTISPRQAAGLYVGFMLALELGFDITIDDNDYEIDVVKINPKKPEFLTNMV